MTPEEQKTEEETRKDLDESVRRRDEFDRFNERSSRASNSILIVIGLIVGYLFYRLFLAG